MFNNSAAYKYKTTYKGPFMITQCCNNGTATLQYSAIKIRYNICHIKPYKHDTRIEDIKSENIYDDFNT